MTKWHVAVSVLYGFLCACASAPSGIAPTPGLVILGTQGAIQATQGAALLSDAQQRSAQATADEAQRQGDLSYQQRVIAVNATAVAMSNQATLDTLHISQTQSAAIATQNYEQRQVVLAVTAEYRRAARAEVESDMWMWGGALFVFAMAIALILSLAGLFMAGENFVNAIADERRAKAAQMLLALAANGAQLQYNLFGQTWEFLSLPEPEHEEESRVNEDRSPIVMEHGRPVGTLPRNITDAEHLLIASLRSGYSKNVIAPASVIGWDGMRRRDAVNSLRPHVRTKEGSPANGGGTFVEFPYQTVPDLLNAVRRGEVSPCPTISGGVGGETVQKIVENSSI